ncbi:MAG: hypothetical protein M3Q93_02255, partial [Gemmatimonadota bacterium]|nr:hypothetical protein [Gemmatimonadota bacterium]
YRWDDVAVRALQDGSRCRTLLVANGPSGEEALPAGTYRLTLGLDRQRWQTTEPADDRNRYRSEATLALGWS